MSQKRAVECLLGQVHDAVAAAHVDGVDLAQEGQRLVRTQLAGTRHEGADILGQAATAEAEARAEEFAADAFVVADSIGELDHVGTGNLADF